MSSAAAASGRDVSTWPVRGATAARRMLRHPARLMRRRVLPKLIPPSSAQMTTPVREVRIVGLLSSASGIGMSARLCAAQLGEMSYTVAAQNVSGLFGADDGLAFPGAAGKHLSRGNVSIYHLNPSMLLPGLLRSGLGRYYNAFNVGYWAWELETLPREWTDSLRYMDAILVPSSFTRDAVARCTDKPVIVVPHPVAQPLESQAGEARGGGDHFRVLTIFNFGSSIERKNPLALIAAFRKAFGDDAGAQLVLKTGDGARYPDDLARLRVAAAGAANIVTIDGVSDTADIERLFASADVYASLHRSEGFGLTIAEAIMRKIPVVATGWSGNLDFCGDGLSYLVDCALTPFSAGHSDYSEMSGARWAEPSVDHAAAQLRAIREDGEAARTRAAAQKRALIAYLAANTYGHAIAALAAHTEQRRLAASGSA